MKIVRFVGPGGRKHWGRVVDEESARILRGDLMGEHAFDTDCVPIGKLLPPVEPPNILAIGRNFREHAKEMKAGAPPAEPLVFLKATTSVVGSGDAINLPASAPGEVDFEAELAVIMGRLAKCVSEEEALDYVLGYTCANDITARDCRKRRDRQWARGKSFDTFCPLGPVLVTAEAMSPGARRIRSLLNGETMQDGNTADMIFSVASLVSYLSHQFTLLPATAILTGTPPGVGFARDPQVFLRPGDQISVEIEGIGTLTNPVVAQADA